MASILIVGPDLALLEGISQTLAGAGHQVVIAQNVSEAQNLLRGVRPLVALVDRNIAKTDPAAYALRLICGGALVTFRGTDESAEHFPFRLPRAAMAELQLPLERQRLLALVRFVEDRARASGRTPAEGEAIEEVEVRPA